MSKAHRVTKIVVAIQNKQVRKRWRERWIQKNPKAKCPSCRRSFSGGGRFPTVDHIVPLSKGGKDTKDNWQVMCSECNMKKADQMGGGE